MGSKWYLEFAILDSIAELGDRDQAKTTTRDRSSGL